MEALRDIHSLQHLLVSEPALLVYFSTPECTVCRVLKPKVEEMVRTNFPRLRMVFADMTDFPSLAADYRVFTAPTILVFFDGRESIRKSRAFGIDELKSEVNRLYSLIFL